MSIMPKLIPGDALIYKPSSLLGRLIAIKSWMPYSHVEIYVGDGEAVGARPEGVAKYPLRLADLAVVMRPNPEKFRMAGGIYWFDHYAKGQRYDVWGLFRFFTLGKQSTDKQFCSEMATRFYRNAGFPNLFHSIDADLVPPGYFVTLADDFTEVWRA